MGKPCFEFFCKRFLGWTFYLGLVPKSGGGGVLKVHDVLLARAQFCWHFCRDARVFLVCMRVDTLVHMHYYYIFMHICQNMRVFLHITLRPRVFRDLKKENRGRIKKKH